MTGFTIPRKLWFLGLIGLLPLVAPGLGFLRPFLLFFFAPLLAEVIAWAMGSRRTSRAPSPDPPAPLPDLPLPGPAARGGAARYMLRYHLSTVLMLLNPFQLAQVVRQL